jgi:hypothetical protein
MTLCPDCGAYWKCECQLTVAEMLSELLGVEQEKLPAIVERWRQEHAPHLPAAKNISVSYDTYTGDWIH